MRGSECLFTHTHHHPRSDLSSFLRVIVCVVLQMAAAAAKKRRVGSSGAASLADDEEVLILASIQSSSSSSSAAPPAAAAEAAASVATGGKRKRVDAKVDASTTSAPVPAAAAATTPPVSASVAAVGDRKDMRTAHMVPLPPLLPLPPLTYPTAPVPPLATTMARTANVAAAAAGLPAPSNSDSKSKWHPVQPRSTENGQRPTVDFTVGGKTANFEVWELAPFLPTSAAEATTTTAPPGLLPSIPFPESKISDKFTITRLAKPRLTRDAISIDGAVRYFSFFIMCGEDDPLKSDMLKSTVGALQFYDVTGFLTLTDERVVPNRRIHYTMCLSEATQRFGLIWRKFVITVTCGQLYDVQRIMHEKIIPMLAIGRVFPVVIIQLDVVERMGLSYIHALNKLLKCSVLVTESEFIAHPTSTDPKWHGLPLHIVADGTHRMSDLCQSDPMSARHAFVVIGSRTRWAGDDDATPLIVPWVEQTVNQLVNLVQLYRMQLMTQIAALVKLKPENTITRRTFLELFCKSGSPSDLKLKAISGEACDILRGLIDPRLTVSVMIGHAAALRHIEPRDLGAVLGAQAAFVKHTGGVKHTSTSAKHAVCDAVVVACVYTVTHLLNDHIRGNPDSMIAGAGASAAAAAAPNNS